MTAYKASSKRIFSIFDVAALKDTNWYDFVDDTLVDPTLWGKMIGCGFLTGSSCNF
jgi:hypothetical protein